jgi:hypothetical protein
VGAAWLSCWIAAAPVDVAQADLNGDLRVGFVDLAQLGRQWLRGTGSADLNGDGEVNAPDLALMARSWGMSPDGPIINEFLGSNTNGIVDKDNDTSDWIEIYNPTDRVIDLGGWYLTDNIDDPTKWQFPAVSLNSGGYLVVFASRKDRREVPGELHTSFSLQAGGESVALVRPDGVTIAHAYIDYPPQLADLSYGLSGNGAASQAETVLIAEGADARATDAASNISRDPLFRYPTNSPEYYGTIVQDLAIHSSSPATRAFGSSPSSLSCKKTPL